MAVLKLCKRLSQGDIHRLGGLGATVIEVVEFVHPGLGALVRFGRQIARVILKSVLMVERDVEVGRAAGDREGVAVGRSYRGLRRRRRG